MKNLILKFENGVFVPLSPVDLPAGTELTVDIEGMLRLKRRPLLDIYNATKDIPPGDGPEMPADYASQTDHYLYGTPKL